MNKKKIGQTRVGTLKYPKLQISVTQIKKIFEICGLQAIVLASIFLAGVLDYITAEILALAGNIANDEEMVQITPEHVDLTIKNDPELVLATRTYFNSESYINSNH